MTEELAEWAARTLRAAAPNFAASRITGLAIDCHPWHGHLELCLRTQDSQAGVSELGDWDFPELAQTTDEGCREEADRMGSGLRSAWEGAGDDQTSVAAEAYRACAAALSSPPVIEALRLYALSPRFQLFCGDPDDPKERNLCSRADSQRVREEVGVRAPAVKRKRPRYEIEAAEAEPGLWQIRANGYLLSVNTHTGETGCEGPDPALCDRFRRSLGYYLPPDYPERAEKARTVFRNLASPASADRKTGVDSLVRWLDIPPQPPI